MEACLWIRLILSLPVFNQTSSGFGSILIAIPIFTLFRNIMINISGGYGSVGWGMFPERIRIQTLLAVNAFINGLAFLAIHRVVLLTQGRFRAIAVLFSLAAVHGATFGGRLPLLNVTWGDFFGRISMGSIVSFSNPFGLTANAQGPIHAASFFDIYGSYMFRFYLYVVCFGLPGALWLFIRRPMKPVGQIV